MPARVESRWQAGKSAYESRIQDECGTAMRGIGNGKIGRTHGDGVGILYRNAIASRIATGNLKVLIFRNEANGSKIFWCLRQAQASRSHGAGISRILRDKRNLPIVVNDK